MTENNVNPSNLLEVGFLSGSVGFLLSKAAQKLNDLHNPVFEKSKIQPKQYGILSLLKIRTNLSQIEIGRELMIDRSTMVILVDDLEQKNLVIRSRDARDRRAYSLALTRKGHKLQEKLSAQLTEIETGYLQILEPHDAESLKKMLRQLVLQR